MTVREGHTPLRRMSSDRTPPSDRRPDADQGHVPPDRDAAPAASEPDGADRVAETGHAYTGRQLSDDLKETDRVTTPGAGLADDDGHGDGHAA